MAPEEWIQSITAEQLPPPPIRIDHARYVVDPGRWLATLKAESRMDPKSWRRRTGLVAREIAFVRELIEGKNQW